MEPAFIHRLQNSFDSGVNVNILSNLVYISLDMFKKVRENISDKMVAWLTFLSSDNPEDIMQLVEKYPMFIECYQDIMKFRTKPEELINMFSEALIQMDKNTVKYMIEEQQKELEKQKKELEDNRKELEDNRKELEDNRKELEDSRKVLEETQKVNEKLERELAEVKRQLEALKK